MDSYLASGKIVHIGETEQITDTFKKRVVVVEIISGDQGQYANEVPFELMNKAAHYVDSMKVGDTVDLMFSLGGNAWVRDGHPTIWFGSNKCFNIKVQGGGQATPAQAGQGVPATAGSYADEPVDEIPF